MREIMKISALELGELIKAGKISVAEAVKAQLDLIKDQD